MAIRDRSVNNLLLLFLVDECNKRGYVENPLKLQKLVFLTQRKSVKRRAKGFSYNFFRWKMGPFSADVNNDLDHLVGCGYLTGEHNITLTPIAKDLLEKSEELFHANPYFATNIRRTAGNYASYRPDELRDRVYRMSVFVPKIRKSMLIKTVPMGTLILFRTSDKKAASKFRIDEDWLATLEMIFDPEALESLKQSQQDAIEGRIHAPL